MFHTVAIAKDGPVTRNIKATGSLKRKPCTPVAYCPIHSPLLSASVIMEVSKR